MVYQKAARKGGFLVFIFRVQLLCSMATNTQYYREWYRKNGRKDRRKGIAYAIEWKKANMEKVRAHQRVQYATKVGKLIRPKECSVCGISGVKIEAHHEDYAKALDVVWLCSSCHKKNHCK